MTKRKFLRRLRRMLEDHADALALARAAETVDLTRTTPLDEVEFDGESERDTRALRIYQTPSTGTVTVACTCPVRAHGACLIHDARVWS